MTIRLLSALLVILAVLLPGSRAGMPEKKKSYDSYRMVRTRNIFDPDRRAMSAAPVAQTVTTSPPPTQADYVALNGILITEAKTLAFFSGSRPEYNKVLPLQETIAGAKVVKITPDSIVVDRDGTKFTIAVGQTVPLDNSSAPTQAPAPDPAASSSSNPQTSSSSAPGPNLSEQARRMMERRQRELQ